MDGVQWRVSFHADHSVGVQIGDDYVSQLEDPSVEEITDEVALKIALLGLKLMGLAQVHRQMLMTLALSLVDEETE